MMAYDTNVGIFHPQCYAIIMRVGLCLCLLSQSWLLSYAYALTHTILIAQWSFSADIIPHFCDIASQLKLS